MALEKHIVELSARDTLSPILKKVGTEAESAGRKADDAGRKATKSTQDWGRAASALGAGLGLATAAAIKFANEAEVRQARLETAIQNTGHAYDEYADAIDNAAKSAVQLAFDDDDAIDSLSQLTDATGDAQKAIDDLALAQDIARGRNISLAQATDIVIAAETGRIQSLKRMGIALDASATSQEALAALQQKYAGQAEAYATTNQATWDRVQISVGNALESIGGHLADYQGAILAVSTAGAALGPLGQAFEALDGKAKLAAASSKALNLAMSPAGLLGAATALTAGLIYLVATTDEYSASAKAAEKTNVSLANSYAALAASIEDVNDREAVRQSFAEFSGLQEQAQKDLRTYEELQNAVVEWRSEFPELQSVAVGALNSITEEQQQWLDFNHDGRISIEELTAATEQFGEKALLTSKQAETIGSSLTQALSHADVDVTKVLADYNALEDQWRRGEITGQQFADGVEAINQRWSDYTQYVLDATAATDNLGITVKRTMGGIKVVFSDVLSPLEAWNKGLEKHEHTLTGDVIPAMQKHNAAIDEMVGGFDDVDRNALSASQGLGDYASGAKVAADASADLGDQVDALSESLSSITPPDVLKSTFGAIVGYTNDIVGSIDQVKEWSDALMAPLGTDFQDNGAASKMLDLLQRGIIDTEDYNEALDAQTRIYEDLARAQDASAVIQIKQANYIADTTDATADYLEYLSKLPEAQQAEALAYADADITGRAEDIRALATEYSDMSKDQQDAFAKTVTSAAAVDPMLALILEDMGLIKRSATDPTGWTLAMDTSDAESDMDRLTDAVNNLADIIAKAYNLNVTATLDTSGFWSAWNSLPSYKQINVYTPGGNYGPMMALGGVVPHAIDTAALGRVSAGNLTLVGEHGPELVNLPGGSFVTPNHATRYDDRARGGGGVVINELHIHGVQNPKQFMDWQRQYSSAMERQ